MSSLMTPVVTRVGKGIGALHTPHVPRFAEMVEYTFGRLGWDGARFDVYRCLV